MDLGDDLRDERLQRVVLVFDLLLFETQVPSGFRPFHDDRVREIPVIGRPFFANQPRRPGRRDDRNELRPAPLGQITRQIERKTGPCEDHVRIFRDGRAYHVGKIGERDHDVDPDHSVSLFAGFADLLPQPVYALLGIASFIAGIEQPQPGCRYDSDAPFVRDGRSQSVERYAHAHTALYDGQFDFVLADEK